MACFLDHLLQTKLLSMQFMFLSFVQNSAISSKHGIAIEFDDSLIAQIQLEASRTCFTIILRMVFRIMAIQSIILLFSG